MKTIAPLVLGLLALALRAEPPPVDTATVDDQGFTHVTRLVPSPPTVSAEAQAMLLHPAPSILSSHASVAEQRTKMNARQAKDAQAWLTDYPAKITEAVIAGVPVHVVTPEPEVPSNQGRVFINLHGGGLRVDAGSLLESIPIAHLTGTKVVSVLYRMAPEHPFPAAVDDVVAVYRELLKTYPADHIGLYGTSAGAILTGESAARLRQLGLPLPAALGVFSGLGDFSQAGDSLSLFTIQGLTGMLAPAGAKPVMSEYVGSTNPRDSVLSPVYGDLSGYPPTLFVTSTRDMLLSGTVVFYQAFLKAGVDARLSVFEALPHAFWLNAKLPEAKVANAQMAQFLDTHVHR